MKKYIKEESLCYVKKLIEDSECGVDFSAQILKRMVEENPSHVESYKSFFAKEKEDYYSEAHRIYIELNEMPKEYKQNIQALRQALSKNECNLPFAEKGDSDNFLIIGTVFKIYHYSEFIGYNTGVTLPDFFKALDSLSETLFNAYFPHTCTQLPRVWTDLYNVNR